MRGSPNGHEGGGAFFYRPFSIVLHISHRKITRPLQNIFLAQTTSKTRYAQPTTFCPRRSAPRQTEDASIAKADRRCIAALISQALVCAVAACCGWAAHQPSTAASRDAIIPSCIFYGLATWCLVYISRPLQHGVHAAAGCVAVLCVCCAVCARAVLCCAVRKY